MKRYRKYWVFLSLNGILILASIPLVLGLVPPNRWYGIRLPDASRFPSLWYEINSLGGKMFIASMAICAAINLLLMWLGSETLESYLGWINAGLILLSFWFVSLILVGYLP